MAGAPNLLAMESSSFSHKEVVKLDFARAYQALRHDVGVLLGALFAATLWQPDRLSPPARSGNDQHCPPVAGRNQPDCV